MCSNYCERNRSEESPTMSEQSADLINMDEEQDKKNFRTNDNCPESHVLVLYTGGTIGMIRNKEGVLVPVANEFVKNLRKYPQLYDREYAEKRFNEDELLVLPMNTTDKRRVIYKVLEYSNLCDSSNMSMNDWIRITKDIEKYYLRYDGFVVLHGTDTLSYTASALSFMLEALSKPVILTGSQVPIFDTRSDGLDNFLSSLVIAANYNIPEVCVFFGRNLLRGNRTSKVSADSFEAFQSPNCPPLATAHVKIQVNYLSIFRSIHYPLKKFSVHASLNQNVGILRLFPGITSNLVKTFLQPPIKGAVLQSYGTGNIPTNCPDIIEEIRAASKRGVIIVNITQCLTGSVSNIYAAGKLLEEAGVISGSDMTPEAALTKLAYVLSKSEWKTEYQRKMIQINLRGELTANEPFVQERDLIEAVARYMGISSTSERTKLESILYPAMLNDAVHKHDIKMLEILVNYGVEVSRVASREGNVPVVQRLLEMDHQNVDETQRTSSHL